SKGSLGRHAKKCWSEDTVNAVKECKSLDKARSAIATYGHKSQSKLTLALRTVKSWFQLFSTRAPDKNTIRVVTARWVAESARPFLLVADRCYRWLQKEGRPDRYVPSATTVAEDVKKLYCGTREKLARELQAYDGELPVAIDCWTSPNHLAFMSITI
ncbi:hypothetical protein F5880DRAFT_1452089, partial [Lentinula raphanica]